MIDVSPVTERFLLLSSLDEADDIIEALCLSGARRVEHMVKDDADLTDSRLIHAAASDAYYQWVLLNKTEAKDDFKSFRAGDITIQNDASICLDAAKTIKDEAFEAITDLLDDKGFYFGEVLINDIEPAF